MVSSIVQHQKGHNYMRLHLYLLALSLAITAFLVMVGSMIVFLLPLPRIPLIYQEIPAFEILTLTEILKTIFPTNFFLVFSNNGDFLLPIMVAALIVGYAMRKMVEQRAQLINISNRMSELFGRINEALIGLMGLGTIALSTYFMLNLRLITDITIYLQLILTLLVITIVLIFGVYPLLARLLKVGKHSYAVLIQLCVPALVGAVAGDSYLATPILLKSLAREYPEKEGVLAHIAAHGAIFTKGGTALVTIISFFVVLQSYSALGITLVQALWFLLLAIILSPIAGAYPNRGVMVFLVLLTSLYGRGIDDAFLVLVPITVILLSVAIFVDTITTGFIGHIALQKILKMQMAHNDYHSSKGGNKKRQVRKSGRRVIA